MSSRFLANHLNGLGAEEAQAALLRCCGSRRWASAMVSGRPFQDDEAVFSAADDLWWSLEPQDWLEAFSHHPRLGDRKLKAAAATGTQAWSRQEQAGTAGADVSVQEALARGNADYEARFGYVFLLCATGKNAEDMLRELRRRLPREPQEELRTAAREQAKITRLRLAKLPLESPGRTP